ncbi:MAG: TIGR04076 family protein [Clostridia bacterium]|nr:TIGR04076 family protein [Clostridia bacterium]
MKKVKITVMKITTYPELSAIYENPIEHTCDMQIGKTFISVKGKKPLGFCDSAWDSVKPFVKQLAKGKGNFFDGWMKNPYSAMISCNDGFRPVSFYIEVVE